MNIYLRKYLNVMATFTLILSTIAVFLFLYWYIYPYNVLEIKYGNGEVINPIVKSGGYLQVRKVFCKNTNVPIKIDRKFIDGLEQSAPQINEYTPIGCYDRIENIYIPKALPPDTQMHLETTMCAKVNPIREICQVTTTGTFTISKEK